MHFFSLPFFAFSFLFRTRRNIRLRKGLRRNCQVQPSPFSLALASSSGFTPSTAQCYIFYSSLHFLDFSFPARADWDDPPPILAACSSIFPLASFSVDPSPNAVSVRPHFLDLKWLMALLWVWSEFLLIKYMSGSLNEFKCVEGLFLAFWGRGNSPKNKCVSISN